MDLNVYKFGGASIKDAENITNVGNILASDTSGKLLCVVSATGKTTNALEKVVDSYVSGKGDEADLLHELKTSHLNVAKASGVYSDEGLSDIMDSFVEIDWVIEDIPQDPYDYIYDQIVSVGEIVSSKILYYHLKFKGLNVVWMDIRDVLFTDEIHREAKVNWDISQPKIKTKISKLLNSHDVIITQGFIGSTQENHTTTLGREGSDYTAAILSYSTDAKSMHIWKDVPGVLTGDPRLFDNPFKLEKLSYREAIEMTYYGAKVIHPKTIKPLQNKNIPMYVRPFNDVHNIGTIITNAEDESYPPIIVIAKNQAMINVGVSDFSFVAEHHLSDIFKRLAKLRIKVNLMRNTAISFTMCVDNDSAKIKALEEEIPSDFNISITRELELITIRHHLSLIHI